LKRIVVAIAILLFVSTLCVITLNYQTTNIKNLIKITDDMNTAFKNNDLDKCLEQSIEFVDKFKDSTRLFPLFMRHSDVSKIEESVVTLPVLLETNNPQHFAAELEKCKNMLESLADLEIPSLENIF
jgi:hypothetical protein